MEYKPCYFEEEINKIINQLDINQEDKKRLLLDINKDNTYVENIKALIKKNSSTRKSKQSKEPIKEKEKEKNEKHKLGRKRKNDTSTSKRNKYNADNITKKIKKWLNYFIIDLTNKLINSVCDTKKINQKLAELNLPKLKSNNKNQIIKKIDYKSIANITKKEDNLNILNLNIKEYLSKNISSKYNISNNNYNKLIISSLLEDKQHKDIFRFVFEELKIENWLEIFTHQNNIENYFNNCSLGKEQKLKIEKSIVGIEEYLLKLINLENDDKIYYHCFLILMYNYKNYLKLKEGRTSNKKDKMIK